MVDNVEEKKTTTLTGNDIDLNVIVLNLKHVIYLS